MTPTLMTTLAGIAFAAFGIHNFQAMLQSMSSDEEAQVRLKRIASMDGSGVDLFRMIRERFGWWGISRSYGVMAAALPLLFMPTIVKIVGGSGW